MTAEFWEQAGLTGEEIAEIVAERDAARAEVDRLRERLKGRTDWDDDDPVEHVIGSVLVEKYGITAVPPEDIGAVAAALREAGLVLDGQASNEEQR